MDPTTNPTPTPNPTPAPGPAPATPGTPTPAMAAGGITTPPVNPVINPAGPAPAGGPAPAPAPVPGAAAQPGALAATDPIMMPEPAPAPDPVEEELKAPMKAAAPAPGSIGSAVSGPATETNAEGADSATQADNPFAKDNKQTPSVAFNDPATQEDPANASSDPNKPAKKKNNKTTLIILIAVASVIVIALIVVLVMQLIPGNNNQTINVTTPNSTVTEPQDTQAQTQTTTPQANGGGGTTGATTSNAAGGTLSCTRNMTASELAQYNDALSGTIGISVDFDANMNMSQISMVGSVVYKDENATSNEPVQETIHEATAADINSQSALVYNLPVSADGTVSTSMDAIQANYESLDYVCRVL